MKTLCIALAMLALGAGAALHAQQPPLPKANPDEKPHYTWEPREGSADQFYLLFLGKRIGVFDAKTRLYRNIIDPETGKLSEPVKPPWADTDTDPYKSKTKQTKKVVPEDKDKDEEPPQKFPPWVAFLIGGGITVVILFIGFFLSR